jgi:hypothetical protein
VPPLVAEVGVLTASTACTSVLRVMAGCEEDEEDVGSGTRLTGFRIGDRGICFEGLDGFFNTFVVDGGDCGLWEGPRELKDPDSRLAKLLLRPW